MIGTPSHQKENTPEDKYTNNDILRVNSSKKRSKRSPKKKLSKRRNITKKRKKMTQNKKNDSSSTLPQPKNNNPYLPPIRRELKFRDFQAFRALNKYKCSISKY